VVYFLFDLLWCDGRDLTGKTVVQRRERLEEIINPVAGVQGGGYVEGRGKDLFRLAKEKGLEGIHRETKNKHLRAGETLTRLVEDQVTSATRVRCVRFHRRQKEPQQTFRRPYSSRRIATDACAISGTPEPGSVNGE
jgi:hypothetical protein